MLMLKVRGKDSGFNKMKAKVLEYSAKGFTPADIFASGNTGFTRDQIAGLVFREKKRLRILNNIEPSAPPTVVRPVKTSKPEPISTLIPSISATRKPSPDKLSPIPHTDDKGLGEYIKAFATSAYGQDILK